MQGARWNPWSRFRRWFIGKSSRGGSLSARLVPRVSGAQASVPLSEQLQVGDELGALLRVGHAGERHLVAGHGLLRVGEKGIEALLVPGHSSAFHRPAVAEPVMGPGLSADEALQSRPGAVRVID